MHASPQQKDLYAICFGVNLKQRCLNRIKFVFTHLLLCRVGLGAILFESQGLKGSHFVPCSHPDRLELSSAHHSQISLGLPTDLTPFLAGHCVVKLRQLLSSLSKIAWHCLCRQFYHGISDGQCRPPVFAFFHIWLLDAFRAAIEDDWNGPGHEMNICKQQV